MECKSMTSKDVLLHRLGLIIWVPTRQMNGCLIMKLRYPQLMEEQCFFTMLFHNAFSQGRPLCYFEPIYLVF